VTVYFSPLPAAAALLLRAGSPIPSCSTSSSRLLRSLSINRLPFFCPSASTNTGDPGFSTVGPLTTLPDVCLPPPNRVCGLVPEPRVFASDVLSLISSFLVGYNIALLFFGFFPSSTSGFLSFPLQLGKILSPETPAPFSQLCMPLSLGLSFTGYASSLSHRVFDR